MRLPQPENWVRNHLRARFGAKASGRVSVVICLAIIALMLCAGLGQLGQLGLLHIGTTHAATTDLGRQIPISARLLDPVTHLPVANGDFTVRYAIYSIDRTSTDAFPSDSDAASRLWSETKTVAVKNGLLFSFLGDTTALPSSIDFSNNALFLGIRINNDPELVPRRKLGTVPAAISADNVQGKVPGTGANSLVTTDSTGSVQILGSPPGLGTASLLQLGSAIVSGSSNGTYLGLNAPGGYAGNLLDFQVGGSSKVKIDAAGTLTVNSCIGCSGASVTLQGAYTAGNTISTTDARDIGVTLNDTATDANFVVNIAAGSTSKFAVQNAGTDVLRVTSGGVNIVTSGLTVTAGGINVNSTGITNAGAIAGATTINASGGVTVGSLDASSGGITNTGALSGATTGAFSSTVTLSGTGASELAVTGAPAVSATSSLVQIGTAITGGNAAANGGTYLGLNQPNAGAGSAADLLHFQHNGTTEFKVDSGGNGLFNGTVSAASLTVNGSASIGTSGQNITVNSSIIPSAGGINVGSSTNHFDTGYFDNLNIGSTNVNGTSSLTFAIDTGQTTNNTDTQRIQFYLGPTLNTYAALQWTGSTNQFDLYSRVGTSTYATLKVATLNAATSLQLNGTDINTAGTLSNVAYQNQSNTFSAANSFSVNGALSTPAEILTGSWFSGGSATTTKPQFLVEPSGTASTAWSTSGTGIGVNSASGFAGNLIDLQVAASSKFIITSAGAVTAASTINSATISGGTLSGGTVSGGTLSATAVNGLSVASGTISSQLAVSTAGAASTPAGIFSGTWFSGGSGSTTTPQVLIQPSGTTSSAWSTSGTALGVNGASGFSGNLVDLQVNGSSVAKITSGGALTVSSCSGCSSANPGGSGTELQYRGGATTFSAVSGSSVTARGDITIAPAAATSGTPTHLTVTGAAHTTLAASTEAIDVNLNLARTVQFTGGALTTQRAAVVQAPTYAFTSTSTITNAATVAITGAPAPGANATITNSYALWIQGGTSRFDGEIIGTSAGAASTPGQLLSGAWFTGGSTTTTKPQLLIEPSTAISTNWSTSGTGLGVNASPYFVGNLADFQTSSSRAFSVSATGGTTVIPWLFDAVLRTTTAESSFADATASANGSANFDVFANSGALNDRTYFGFDAASWRQMTFKKNTGTGGTVSFEVCTALSGNACGTWTAISGGSDGTTGFTTNGDISWTNVLVKATVNSVSAYWLRATVTSGMSASANGLLQITNPNNTSSIGLLVQGAGKAAAATGYSANGTFIGADAPLGSLADFVNFTLNGASQLKVDTNGKITNGAITSTGLWANSTAGTALQLTGTITASTSISEIRMGTAITSGASAGNYIGINAANGFSGNFLEFEANGTTKFKVVGTGDITASGNLVLNLNSTAQVGLIVKAAASAVSDLIEGQASDGSIKFYVDVTGKLGSGQSLPGVPLVGVDPNSGGTAGNLTGTSSALETDAGAGLTLNIRQGSAYTGTSPSSSNSINRCIVTADTTLAMADNTTNYVYVTSNNGTSTSGPTCTLGKQATVPTFDASKPTIVIAKVVTSGGSISSVADTRFFIGGSLIYVKTAAATDPGSIVITDTSADNQVKLSTTGADTGVAGIVVVGNGGAGTAIMMTSGHAYAQAVSGAARAACAGTSTTSGAVNNVTAAVNACIGRVLTNASSSLLSVLVEVAPN